MATTPTIKLKPFPDVSSLDPGIEPLEFNVLVMMPLIEEKTSGGLLMADETKDHESTGQTIAMMVALSPMAFSFAEWPRNADRSLAFEEKIPRPGLICRIKKYAGTEWRDEAGNIYRIINDKDVLGVVPRPKPKKIISAESNGTYAGPAFDDPSVHSLHKSKRAAN